MLRAMTEAAQNLPREARGNLPPPRAGQRRGGGLERILLTTSAALLGVMALSIVPPLLSEVSSGGNLLWVVIVIPVWFTPFGLLIPAIIWPRSVVAAAGAALPVGFLLMLGENAEPMSWPRFAIHIAAILILAALVLRISRGIADRGFRELSIVWALFLGFMIGYLAAVYLGFHIREQFCGPEILSILCSG